MPVLIGNRIALRQIVAADFPKLVEWSKDQEINRLIDGNYPESLDECPEWFKRFQSSRHAIRFGIGLLPPGKPEAWVRQQTSKLDEIAPLIGDIELDHITWRSSEAELRIRIGQKSEWDRGYGTDAVELLLHHAFTSMKLHRVYLRVYRFNVRAMRCYEKCGFKKEGRLVRPCSDGELREVILMRILREEFERRVQPAVRTAI